ncbi:hypothetical protein Hte_009691 [Hypoxylon texense]
MASVSLSSLASSSPISFQDHDPLTLELQPPPLRLPQRKAGPGFDGSASVYQKQTSEVSDDPFTSTIHSGRSSPSPQPATTKISSQYRATAPKLDSLVSKFEILDAVNSAEVSPSFGHMPSTTPRFHGSPVRPGRPAEPSQQVPSSIDRHGATRNYFDLSPRQDASPPPSTTKSRLPVSTPLKPKVEENADTDLYRLDNAVDVSVRGGQPPTNRTLPIQRLDSNGFGNEPTHGITSRADRRPG